MPRHYFSEGDITRARMMRESGQSWTALARYFNCSEETIRRYMDDEYRKKRADRYRPDHLRFSIYGNPSRMTSAEARRVISTVPADTRSRMAKWMGDPLPGRSALDARGSQGGCGKGCTPVENRLLVADDESYVSMKKTAILSSEAVK
jgi:hypothetical protein